MTEKPGKASIVFKILYVGFFAVFILVIVINGLCSDWEWRYNYQPGTQFDKSIELTYRRYPAGFETNFRYADIVVRGKITRDGEETSVLYEEAFPFKVTEVLAGELEEEKITFLFQHGMRLGSDSVHRNDDLVLFLYRVPEEEGWRPAAGQSGIFAVLPEGFVYAFNGAECFKGVDGQRVETLYQAILSAAENIRANPGDYADTTDPRKLLPQIIDPGSNVLDHLKELVQTG